MVLSLASAAPTPTPPAGGPWKIPEITPDFSGPGVAGVTSMGNWLAAIALVSAVVAVILGATIAIVGPLLSFHHARTVGIAGVIGGLAMGIAVASATSAVSTVGSWF